MSDKSPSRPSSLSVTVNCVLYLNGFLEVKNNRIKVIKRVAYPSSEGSQCGQLQTENPPDERKGAICQSCMRHYHSY